MSGTVSIDSSGSSLKNHMKDHLWHLVKLSSTVGNKGKVSCMQHLAIDDHVKGQGRTLVSSSSTGASITATGLVVDLKTFCSSEHMKQVSKESYLPFFV